LFVVVFDVFNECVMCLDPLYTVSSEKDHARATFEAHAGPQKLVSAYHVIFF